MDKVNKALIAVDPSGSYRVYLAVTTKLAEDARQIHRPTALATAALGRVLTGAGIMGLMMKNSGDKLTVQFKGDGPAGEILATAYGSGTVKGYISNPDVDLPLRADGKPDVGGAVGIGALTVIKDLGLKEPYVGRIDLVSGEIADDLTMYFFLSEQQSSSVALGVRVDVDCSVKTAGGMVIQMLPGGDPAAVDYLEAAVNKISSITAWIESAEEEACSEGKDGEACAERTLELLLDHIFGEMPEEYRAKFLEYRDLAWKCDCSEERLEQVLQSLGKKELAAMIEEDGQAELMCQFCTKKYHFNRERLENILVTLCKNKKEK